MVKRATGIFSMLLIISFLLAGCASGPANREAKQTSVVVTELVRSAKSWDGALLPSYPEGQPEITILRILIPAGTRLDTHSHPVINAGVLLRGELTVLTVDGETLRLEAGDPIVEVVGKLHYGINEGEVPAEIIVFYAGAAGIPITVIEK
mgnify:CR=1 FL=1